VAGRVPGRGDVRNSGTSAINGWTVGFTFANGQQITQRWRGTVGQSGSAVTATNLSWNGNLGPSASTTFGFLANWNGTNAVPTRTCTAG
jgi:mannan endo-1,4-beta-mannosidase